MKVRFIVNPKAGLRAGNSRLLAAVHAAIAESRGDTSLETTRRAGHATELARAAADDGFAVVVAVGGDGTVNEIARGLLGTRTALALLPCGSGNGLARHLGVPRDARSAVALALAHEAPRLAMDTGTVNGVPFLNVMGLGLDAAVSQRFAHLEKRGPRAYVAEAWGALRAHRPERVRVEADGASESLEVTLLSIANSDQWGNNARVAPGARVDDGALDLVALGPVGLGHLPLLAARLFLGSFHRSSRVQRRRATSFVLQREAPGLIHVDGEPLQADARLEVRVHPASLHVVVPSQRPVNSLPSKP